MVDGTEETGYTKLPPIEEAVAAHLCLLTALGWKSKASHPSKPRRVTSALGARAYAASS